MLAAEPIIGRASVIDGDTIEIHGARIRLEGIDAPESRQLCTESATGQQIRCGQRAAFWLSELIRAHTVTCTEAGRDRYKRILARCSVAGQDVGAAMVSAGWALAYVRYSREYVEQEARAREARAGIWQWSFEAPWEWRRAQRQR
nr:thermonuclease family protein [Aquabacter cavernae]